MRTRSRALTVLLLAGLWLIVAVPAAHAHTRTQETTNLDSRLTAVPELPGVAWTVHTGGFLVGVVNTSEHELLVLGYEGEPYLRIGPDGVWHNRRSPATYLNEDRYGDVALPPIVDADAEPAWEHVDGAPRALWHDHRTHWMSTRPPPFVDAGGLATFLMQAELVGPIGRAGPYAGTFQEWAIPVVHAGRSAEIRGELVWQDPPPAGRWLLLAGLCTAVALAGLRRDRLVEVLRPAALVVAAVAMVNTIHLVDDLIAYPSDPLDELFGVLHTTLFLAVGIGGALWSLRIASGRVLALAIASGAVLYHQGLVHLPMLQASHFPSVWPQSLVRATVALGLVQAVPVALVLLRARRLTAGPGTAGSARDADLAPVH